ncbi:glycerophosphodiester phosphodiesterase family protein [uncultured Cohaesibacter sp.]|uniref:glycerophosphodiester phosphodiesterase family protein n=1 Tax=uncultured Cohaesibacter sp. TaxID=1002546 RepID=UPI002931D1DC|nr:glycerophosphodiester phosphodiesterase family protein [uncultured Cohaesibacter sp.]
MSARSLVNCLLLAIALCAPASSVTAQPSDVSSIRTRFAGDQPVVLIAHRANGFGFPENSLAGIKAAIDAGIDMIELDVRVSADHVHYLMHDRSLDRTTNVQARFPDGPPKVPGFGAFAIADNAILFYKSDEINTLELKAETSADHAVPTLEEALKIAKGRILIDLDVKDYQAEELGKLVRTYGTDNLMVRNPSLDKLKAIYDATGASPLHSLDQADNKIARLHELKALFGEDVKAVEISAGLITPDLAIQAKQLGIRLWVNGLAKPDRDIEQGDVSTWQRVLGSGARAFQTDYPLTVKPLFEK